MQLPRRSTPLDTSTPTGARTLWEIDPTHTLIEFSINHLMVSTVKGRFTGVRGTIALDQSPTNDSSVDVELDVKSLYTGNEARDQHVLASPDFLDVEHFPTISFKSSHIELVDL